MMKNSKNLIYFSLLFIAILALSAMIPNIANAQSAGVVNAYNSTAFGNVYPNGGYNSYNAGLSYNPTPTYNPVPTYNPIPVIYSINPSTVNRNLGSVLITITGNNFIPGALVRLNGVDQITTYVNSTSLRIYLSDLSKMNLNSYVINVYNPGPGGGISNSVTLYIEGSATVSTNTSNKTVAKKTTTTTTSATTAQAKNTTSSTKDEALVATALFGLSGFLPSGILGWLLLLILILIIVYVWRKIYITDEKPLKHH